MSMCDHQKWAGSGNRTEWPAWTATKLWPHKDEPFDVCEAYEIENECKVVEWQLNPGQHDDNGDWYVKRKGEGEPVMHDETAPFHENQFWNMPRQQVVLCCCNESNCNTKEKVDAYTGPFLEPKDLPECRIRQKAWHEADGEVLPGLGYWNNVTKEWKKRRSFIQEHMIKANMGSERCVVYAAGGPTESGHYQRWGKANARQFWLGRGHTFSGSKLMKEPNRAPLVAPDVCELYGIEGDGCKMVKWQLFPPTHPDQLNAYAAAEDGEESPIFFDETTKYEGFPDVKPVHFPKPDDNYTRDYIPVHDVKLCCCKGRRCASNKFLKETPIQQPTTTSTTTTTTTTSTTTTTAPTARTTKVPTSTTEQGGKTGTITGGQTGTTAGGHMGTTARGKTGTDGSTTITSPKSSIDHSTTTPTDPSPKQTTTSDSAPKTTTKGAEGKTDKGNKPNGADGGANEMRLFVICLICILYVQF